MAIKKGTIVKGAGSRTDIKSAVVLGHYESGVETTYYILPLGPSVGPRPRIETSVYHLYRRNFEVLTGSNDSIKTHTYRAGDVLELDSGEFAVVAYVDDTSSPYNVVLLGQEYHNYKWVKDSNVKSLVKRFKNGE